MKKKVALSVLIIAISLGFGLSVSAAEVEPVRPTGEPPIVRGE